MSDLNTKLARWLVANIITLTPLCENIADNYGAEIITPENVQPETWDMIIACYWIKVLVEAMPEDD